MRVLRNLAIFVAVALLTAGFTIGLLIELPRVVPQLASVAEDPAPWPEAISERTIPKPSDPVSVITIAAVGDLMAHLPIVSSAKVGGAYDFTSCFEPVADRLSSADLAIGNFETVLAGSSSGYTGYPTFNSPDAYASAAVGAGFDVLTTANNHALDRGPAGVTSTLNTLDKLGVLHTGTARTEEESKRVLVADVDGMKVAILAYTYGMNGFTAPSDRPWMVDVINQASMAAKVKTAREQGADLVIVCIHNGVEYERQPTAAQEKVELAMVEAGADVVLGSHPHVLEQMETVQATRADGSPRVAFVIHSLGNFMSGQRERYRDTGVILRLRFEKNLHTGASRLLSAEYVPVWVDETLEVAKPGFRVLPIADVLANPVYPGVTEAERGKLRQAWEDTSSLLGSTSAVPEDPGALVFYCAPL